MRLRALTSGAHPILPQALDLAPPWCDILPATKPSKEALMTFGNCSCGCSIQEYVPGKQGKI